MNEHRSFNALHELHGLTDQKHDAESRTRRKKQHAACSDVKKTLKPGRQMSAEGYRSRSRSGCGPRRLSTKHRVRGSTRACNETVSVLVPKCPGSECGPGQNKDQNNRNQDPRQTCRIMYEHVEAPKVLLEVPHDMF